MGAPVGKYCLHNHHHRHHRSYVKAAANAKQLIAQSAEQLASERILVLESRNITIKQNESQVLFLTQAALEGALHGIIILGKKKNLDVETKALQAIIQRVKQRSSEQVRIVKSNNVTIEQSEVQYADILQAAIELLAQIVAKI